MNRRRLIIGVAALAAFVAGLLFGRGPAIDEQSALREIAPGVLFSAKGGNPPHYWSASGPLAFNSFDIAPGIRGYAGPIKVLVLLAPDGTLRGLKILTHSETKNYVHYLETPAYLNQFLGKRVTDLFEVDRDIDGISRATVSARALARTVRDSSRIVAEKVWGMRVPGPASAQRTGWSWALAALLMLAGFGCYALTRRGNKRQGIRDLVLAASLAITGFWLATPFSVLQIYNLILFRFSSSPLWYVTVIGTLASVAVAGRFYCGWLCPFGALAEFLGRAPLRKWSVDARSELRWRELKYALFGGTLVAVLLFRRPEYGNDEVYVTLFSLRGSWPAWALLAVTLLANLRVPRFWCRYLCPVAAFTGLLSRRAAGYPGAASCPMANPRDPEISECIRCNRCYRRREDGQVPELQAASRRHAGVG